MEFSVYGRHNSYITPKGKHGIKLKDDFATSSDAFAYIREHSEELEAEYTRLRTIPAERNDWNRPRIGEDYRKGKDIDPETFNETFPFRGVEFGNWVTQLERSASLNEGYDALMDLAKVVGISSQVIALNNQLALAFGARGSGKYSAHYEPVKVVINLTKTRGAGSLAHEWFHALDNFIMRSKGEKSSFTSDKIKPKSCPLIQAFIDLNKAVKSTGFYERSCKIDTYKSKPYWGTAIELNARAFEKYCIFRLGQIGVINDYLANIKTFAEHTRKEVYPYPTDEEIKVLAPCFDNLLKAVFSEEQALKQSA